MKLYYVPVTDMEFTENDKRLLCFLSEDRRKKISRYRSAGDRRLSLYAALTVRMGISMLTGTEADNLTFVQEKLHKPFVNEFPDIDFSYSHTRGMVLCAITEQDCIGADVEILRDAPLSVMKKAFCTEEQRYVLNIPSAVPLPDMSGIAGKSVISSSAAGERFFEIWTKKEAYTKYLGTGLAAPLREINTLSPSLAPGFYTWRHEQHICSVYGKETCRPRPVMLSEKEITEFFIH